jgi:hypothetical protein
MQVLNIGDVVRINLNRDEHCKQNPHNTIYSQLSSDKYGVIRAIDEGFYRVEYADCERKRKDWYLLTELSKVESPDFVGQYFHLRNGEFTKVIEHFDDISKFHEFLHKAIENLFGLTSEK